MHDRESAARRGYGSRWRKARETWLAKHPLCEMHLQLGKVVTAMVVDHKIPHRGDQSLFWDQGNWQSLCKQCHDSHKQRAERGGAAIGCDLNGVPIDTAHHWRRPGKDG